MFWKVQNQLLITEKINIIKNMLGKLEKVDLRQIWQTEGQDFTPWLAREENLEMLWEVLN